MYDISSKHIEICEHPVLDMAREIALNYKSVEEVMHLFWVIQAFFPKIHFVTVNGALKTLAEFDDYIHQVELAALLFNRPDVKVIGKCRRLWVLSDVSSVKRAMDIHSDVLNTFCFNPLWNKKFENLHGYGGTIAQREGMLDRYTKILRHNMSAMLSIEF